VGWVNGVAVSDDGRRIASCGADNTLRLWHPDTGACIHTFEPGCDTLQVSKHDQHARRLSSLWSVAINGDGMCVAAAGELGIVYVWNTETCRLMHELTGFDGHTSWISSVAMTTLGDLLLSAGRDGMVKLWSLATGRVVHTYRGHSGTVWGCAFAEDDIHAFSGGADGSVCVWHLENGALLAKFAASRGDVFSLSACALQPGLLVTGGWDGVVTMWDWHRQTAVWSHSEHRADSPLAPSVRSVWLSEDGRFVFSGGDSNTVVRVDAGSGGEAITLRHHTDAVNCIMTSFDGLRAFSASKDGTVAAWSFK
jgi:WD40 repeat protein